MTQHKAPSVRSIKYGVQKGFNLVEAAIVLGIIGLVMGGIWVATAHVQRNYAINQWVDGIVFIMSAVEQQPRSNMDQAYMPVADSMGMIPGDWRRIGTYSISTPLKGVTIASSLGIVKYSGTSGLIGEIRMNGFVIGSSLCIEAIRKLHTRLRARLAYVIGDIGMDDVMVDLTNTGTFTCPNSMYSFQFR